MPDRVIVQCWAVRRAAAGFEVLLLRRAVPDYMGGTWQPCTGGVKPGEAAWAAAVRELCEETSLCPAELYALDTVRTFYVPAFDGLWHSVPFCAIIEPAAADVRLNEEHDAFEWVPLASLDDRLTWPGDRETARRLADEVLRGGRAKPYLRVRS